MEQQDLPSPGEEEDFRLHRCLRKVCEKLDVGFSMIWRHCKKGGGETTLEG
jgi:hypothetical protein